jgi:hypothetical protein
MKKPAGFRKNNKENKMKKAVVVLTILAILSVLVACSKTSTTTGTARTSTVLPMEAELLVGTFKLEDTGLAITADQAKQLLPLWQTLQSLSTSSTSATEEINAVVDQIKTAITTAQMDKITAMKLTQQDMMSIMSIAGVSRNGDSTTATPIALNGLPSGGGTQGGAGAPGGTGGPGGGGMPGGGPPSGGAGMPADGGVPGMPGGPTNASGTPQAPRANTDQVPGPLLNALIELLQKKIK